MAPARNELLIVALTTAGAGICLAIGFAHSELASLWRDRPAVLATLALAALILSIAGAAVPSYLPIPKIRSLSTWGQVIAGLLLGAALLMVVAVADRASSQLSVWGLLIYFFFGALVLGAYFILVPRRT